MAERAHRSLYLYRSAVMLALALTVAGCTKGGQFDPTEIFSSDVFDSKKKLQGDRVPVFPDGVPGATTGVPPDLVKGYQAPPEPADADAAVPGPAPPPTAEAEKPKPKPKPKVAVAKPPATPPTRISVGPKPGGTVQQPDAAQSGWPAAPSAAAPQQAGSPSVWPAPPQQAAQSSHSIWPAPQPATSSQPAQPSQSIWPNPAAPAGSSQ
jgi:hypothetical protein